MKTDNRRLLAGVIIVTLVILAFHVHAASAPTQTPATERTVGLKHGTVTMCGMMVLYMVDVEGKWFDAHFGQSLRRLAPQIRQFQMDGQLGPGAELADYYPPVAWSCERLHEAQVQWGRANGASEEHVLEMEKAFKLWRDTYKPPTSR